MATTTTSHKQERSEKTNTVLSVVEVKPLAVRYADHSGNISVGMAFVFGKDADGGPGVYVINGDDLQKVLKLAIPAVKSGVRSFLTSSRPAELPTGDLPTFEPT